MTAPAAQRHLHAMRDLADVQIADSNGLLVGKADDLALDEHGEFGPRVAAVLTGVGALAHRFEHRSRFLLVEAARRGNTGREPTLLPIELVERKPSRLEMTVPRDVATTAQRVPTPGAAFADLSRLRAALRLSDLVGTQCIAPGADPLGRVTDLYLIAPTGQVDGGPLELYLAGLVVGAGAIGSRLGYGLPHGPRGPGLFRSVMQVLARHTLYVPWVTIERRDARAVYTTAARDEVPTLDQVEQQNAPEGAQ